MIGLLDRLDTFADCCWDDAGCDGVVTGPFTALGRPSRLLDGASALRATGGEGVICERKGRNVTRQRGVGIG